MQIIVLINAWSTNTMYACIYVDKYEQNEVNIDRVFMYSTTTTDSMVVRLSWGERQKSN